MNHVRTWPMGEIELEDGTVIRVPQPVQPETLPPVGPLEDFYLTVTNLQPTSLQDWAVNRPRSHAKRQTIPMWAVLCVVAGAFLSVAAGAFLLTVGVAQWAQ